MREEIERALIHHLPARVSTGINIPSEFVCFCGVEMTAQHLETPWVLMARHYAEVLMTAVQALTADELVIRMHAVDDAADALEKYREFGGRYGQQRRKMNNSTRIAGWLRANAPRIARREDPL